MTNDKTEIEKLEERVEELEERQEELTVEDASGGSWSLTKLMDRFEINRRTALKAIGLVAIGYTAPRAVLQAVSGTAEAQQSTDDLTVPGQLNADLVSTGVARTETEPVANVKAYGAVGDGSTDDTQAIRDARNAITVGVVFFPPGDYLVSESIEMEGRSFVGAGRHAATIVAASGGAWDAGGHSASTAVIYDREQYNPEFRDLGVDCNAEDAAGISVFGGYNPVLANNYVRNSNDCGIQFWGNDATGVAAVTDGLITNNIVSGCKWNLVFDGEIKNSVLSNNTSSEAEVSHISVDSKQSADGNDSRGNIVQGNTCWGSSDSAAADGAIRVLQDSDVVAFFAVSDNYIYDWEGDGIVAMHGGSVSDNVIHASSAGQIGTGIVLDNSQAGLRISDNEILVTDVGIASQNSPTRPRIWDNVFDNLQTSEFSITTSSDWVVERNYTNDGTDASPTT